MNKLLTATALLLSLNGSAQNQLDDPLGSYGSPELVDTFFTDPVATADNVPKEPGNFPAAAAEHNIVYRTFDDLEGTADGYYLISEVFDSEKKFQAAVKKLQKKGFAAGGITNNQNTLFFSYLEYHKNWPQAIERVVSKLDDDYKKEVWIMQVANNVSTLEASYASGTETYDTVDDDSGATETFDSVDFDNDATETFDSVDFDNDEAETLDPSDFVETESDTFGNDTLSEVEDDPYEAVEPAAEIQEEQEYTSSNAPLPRTAKRRIRSRLMQKADRYFDKLWYAEAAELYEQALSKGGVYYNVDIIQKAADSHYFNTNMEKAYHWYNVLHEKYGEQLSDDNTFKYIHTLKGTGKYSRAKKLTRLYNKRTNKGNTSDEEGYNTPSERVLDNILNNVKNEYEIKNLAINSEFSDFSAMYLDSTQVVFASAKDSSFLGNRQYKWNNQPYLDLYVAEVDQENQDITEAENFSDNINTKYHEASVTFSPERDVMYFTRNNYGKKLRLDANGVNHLKIYMSQKVGEEWSEAVEVPFNSNEYSTGHPALSPDGKKMYFVSDMLGSIGETDIFVVEVLGKNNFSEPKNLGPEINTDRKEMFPYVNGENFYFSSNGHEGLGGLDIYEVAMDPETGFGEASNMGQPINGNKDDFSFVMNAEKQEGFFASNREGGKGADDIYSFKLVEPENLNAINGIVADIVSGEPMPMALLELLDQEGNLLKQMQTDENGNFTFDGDLVSNTKYILKTTTSEHMEDNREVDTQDNEPINVEISMQPLAEDRIAMDDGMRKLKTEKIYFDFDKSYIRNDASMELDKLVAVMQEYPNMVIKIESHTDSRGSKAYNKYLSDRRAKSTRQYIISQGIEASRIESAKGFGEERLINECGDGVRCSEKVHLQNRRSEFIILNM